MYTDFFRYLHKLLANRVPGCVYFVRTICRNNTEFGDWTKKRPGSQSCYGGVRNTGSIA